MRDRESMGLPFTRIFPDVEDDGPVGREARKLRRVVFPHPEGPMIANSSPRSES